MKGCELCGKPARMYCESDQASLCWDCDGKVHCANFLVARHSRSLLCHVCHSVTPWKAEGPKLTPTVSVCVGCADNNSRSICDAESEVEPVNDDEDEDDDDDDDDENGDDDGDDSYGEDPDADDEGENQVVPWACASSPPPPPAASSSSDEEDGEESSTAISALKRVRENADVDSDDETGCSSLPEASRAVVAHEDVSDLDSTRALKRRRISEANQTKRAQEESRSTAIISSFRRLQNDRVVDGEDATATIIGICKLSREQ
ncbi:zinc finger protein CONSTANS-LIKE 4-like [Carya illinoinensis]|uniref:B box-type domain-containing protein n=1 Tax=Carya illinoinensis TaxID=32201 RepID=A0A8T1P479_CARIL|nr:zinc finger protein CONSTANS-LIKE 4-like [Carya illinoinensis]KAG6637445.1 hypothetical protein CIPAW_11G179100 [Carya illinoinensis]KAG6689458.1 hypothetical protein I3842_11G176200 [Carya illinoinensis]